MTHELKHIIEKALDFQQQGQPCILATVVALDGSSYRKPGVRMLISEDGTMVGAVSGGCVERDVYEQAQSVFKTGIPKIMTYDGRYRLGCEGLLFILIEPLVVSEELSTAFNSRLSQRQSFTIASYYLKEENSSLDYGTLITFSNVTYSLREGFTDPKTELQIFKQDLEPCFRLFIFGGEHDAVKLSTMASLLGWDVHVVTSVRDPKTLSDFPGASSVTAQVPELIELLIDKDTAVVLMNHNYVNDLKYVLKLAPFQPKYMGILGSRKRREKLVDDVFNQNPDINPNIFDSIYSPAGLHIGSVTPEEIALSILAEILAVYRGLSPSSLRSVKDKSVSL